VDQIIKNRENFKPGCKEWINNIMCLCCGRSRRDEFFRKGRRKITLDLDLRTYIKSIRNTHILLNVLLNDRQRALLPYQKSKVLESGSSSESDDVALEPSVLRSDPSAEVYIKKFHAEKVKEMIANYQKNNVLSQVDCNLLFGITTKKKF